MPVTPRGTAVFPHLNTPDTKFDENGVYSPKLALSDEAAAELSDELTAAHAAAYERHCKEQKKPKLKKFDLPMEDELSQDGEPTGNTLFKFKSKARTAKGVARKIVLVDAKKKPLTEHIGGGSQIKINYRITDWYVPALGVGLSLQINGVQVLDLKENSGGNADAMFDEEDGFESSGDTTDSVADSFSSSQEESDGDIPEDF